MSVILPIVVSNVLFAAALILVAVVVTRFWRSPQLAHALWALVLLKLITPPLAAVSVPQHWVIATSVTKVPTTQGAAAENHDPVIDKSMLPTQVVDHPSPAAVYPQSATAHHEGSTPADVVDSNSELSARVDVAESAIEPTPWARLVDFLKMHWLNIVGAIWCVGAVAYALVLLRRYVQFQRVLAASGDATPEVIAAASRLAPTLGLKRCPPVRVVDAPIPPLVWSLGIRPMILLPTGLLGQLDVAQRDAVIAHELAHVRRRDYLIRWLEIVSLVAFWWNPAAWFARRKLREAEEECCDAWVVCALPDQRRSYGQAMVKTIEFLTDSPVLPILAGSAFGSSFYKRRIEMILHHKFRHSASWQAKLLLLALLVCVLPIAVRAMSQDEAIDRSGQTAEDSSTEQAVRKAGENHDAANRATPQQIDATTKALYAQYISRPGKIETTSVQAAIELVAARGHRDPKFRALLVEDFVRSCKEDKFGNVRRKLLDLVAKVLMRDGGMRWQRNEEKRTADIGQRALPPDASLYRESQLLGHLVEYGRKCNASEIDAFVFAVRQAHHPKGKQFLLDVLHNPSNSDPFGNAAKGKWPDNQGGSWRDARFHAAIGLAELGVKDGVRWLIERARANRFGLDDSVFCHPHALAKSGSLRTNCDYALRDLSQGDRRRPRDTWDKWWREKAATFTPRRVTLKP